MTIFSRIYKIIRSEVSNVFPPNVPGSKIPQEEPATGTPTVNIPATEDPVLAQYYANLEVPYGSDIRTVRSGWKKLLKRYHPDLHSDSPEKQQIAEELVKQLNHAYRELEKRLEPQNSR